MATKNVKARLIEEYNAKMTEVNKACAKGTLTEVESRLSELANIEKEYRAYEEKAVYAALPTVRDALEKLTFETIAHKKVSTDGILTGVEACKKNVQIDLKKYCEQHELSTDWFYELQALNKRLTLKVALGLGMKPSEIRKINDSYAMDKLAEQIELGKTPESDTQVIKHMQKVLDMLSEKCGKINGYDLAYVMAGYTKRSNKESLKVVCSKHTILQSLLTDVFHNVITGKGYGVDYKRKNPVQQVEETAEKVSKTSKTPKTPKAEVSAEEVVVTKEETAA